LLRNNEPDFLLELVRHMLVAQQVMPPANDHVGALEVVDVLHLVDEDLSVPTDRGCDKLLHGGRDDD